MKWFKNDEISKELYREFLYTIHAESISRLMPLLIGFALLQSLTLIHYILYGDPSLSFREYIILKLFAVTFSLLSFTALYLLKKDAEALRKKAYPALLIIDFVFIAWSVANAFIAQSLTSDITVYIMVLFATSAVIRLKPWVKALFYTVNYTVFFIGIPYFQVNPNYQVYHIINSFILNIIAFLISAIMYKFNLVEFMDKKEIKRINSELMYLASHDGLTSLYNHQAIYQYLEKAIEDARYTSNKLSVMIVDLDHFKDMNDELGHTSGDTILKMVADCILRNIRQSDIAGRYGGDEFFIILPGSTVEDTKEIAMRLLNEIRQLRIKGRRLSISCGIAGWKGQSAEQLVEDADKALYRVKNNGRDNVYIYERTYKTETC